MINEKISGIQAVKMMILFIFGSSIATGGSLIPEQDSWISILLGMAFSIPIALMYAHIYKQNPGKDLFELSYIVFSRVGGAIVTFLFSAYAILLGTLVIKNFTEYIHVVSIPETPQVFVAICIGLIMFFTVSKGLEVLGRGSAFILPFSIFVIVFLLIFSIKNMDINNLKPIFYNNLKPVLVGAYSVLVFPFSETVLFTVVFASVETKLNPAKLYLISIFIAGFILFVLMLTNTMVLGYPLIECLYFPTYARAAIIEAGKFFSRVEILVSGNFIVFGLVKATVCLYVGCKGLARLFKISSHKKLAAPLSLIMSVGSAFLFENTMQMFNGVRYYLIYAPFFEFVIPLTIFILLKIKLRKHRLLKPAQNQSKSVFPFAYRSAKLPKQ